MITGNVFNVYPDRDGTGHNGDEDCICRPQLHHTTLDEAVGGEPCVIITHRAPHDDCLICAAGIRDAIAARRMTAPRPVIPPTAAGETCESCGDEFDPQEGCLCDGHTYCASCLTNCPACMADLADDYAAEFSMERDR